MYRDQDDTRVRMDICLTTGTVATCIEYPKEEEKKRLADENATRRIKQLEDQMETLRKQVANNKKKEEKKGWMMKMLLGA